MATPAAVAAGTAGGVGGALSGVGAGMGVGSAIGAGVDAIAQGDASGAALGGVKIASSLPGAYAATAGDPTARTLMNMSPEERNRALREMHLRGGLK